MRKDSLQYLNNINNRLKTAVQFHLESADMYAYLSLYGFFAMHEWRTIDEQLCQRKLKLFTTRHCDMTPPDEPPVPANLLSPLTRNKARNEMSLDERWTAVKSGFEAWCRWETDSLEVYSATAKQLSDIGDMAAYKFVLKIVEEVDRELAFINDMITALSGMEWDMPTIVDKQDTWQELYAAKIRRLYKLYPLWHHNNSAEPGEWLEDGKDD